MRGGSEGQSHKDEEREGGSETGEGAQGPLARDGGLYSWILNVFLVTPLLMRPVCLLSQGRF